LNTTFFDIIVARLAFHSNNKQHPSIH